MLELEMANGIFWVGNVVFNFLFKLKHVCCFIFVSQGLIIDEEALLRFR